MKDEEGVGIGMSLPEELDTEEGIATDSGTVVYQSNDSAAVCVRSFTEEHDGISIDGMRELVIIKDKDAPKEYTFNFDLPDGCRLITSEEYCDMMNKNIDSDEEYIEEETGYVYIIDNENTIQSTIESAWAKDRAGNSINTLYSIEGDSLVQHIYFDEKTKFPVIADPKVGDTKKRTHYYTKNKVITIRDKYASDSAPSFWVSVLKNYGGDIPGFGTVWKHAMFMNDRVNATNYKTWNKIVKKFPANKNRARVVLKYRWHRKGDWVATGVAEYSYVNYV